MKKYTIKNYKGNLVESLTRFSKKYPGMKICEAKEEDDELRIMAETQEKTFSVDLECIFRNTSETIKTVEKAANAIAAKYNGVITIVGMKETSFDRRFGRLNDPNQHHCDVILSVDSTDDRILGKFIQELSSKISIVGEMPRNKSNSETML